MSTITKEFTKERLEEIAEDGFLKHGESKALARIALASLEADPVGYIDADYVELIKSGHIELCSVYAEPGEGCIPAYTAPPAPIEAEPVAYIGRIMLEDLTDGARSCGRVWPDLTDKMSGEDRIPLFLSPPAPVSVPDEAIRSAVDEIMATYAGSADECRKLVRKHIEDACRSAMLQGADGTLTNEDTKRVDELVMWIKRLAHSLRKANPDSKLQSDAMEYLSRKGLIGVEDILR